MPFPTATATAPPQRHQWYFQFDCIVCRNCGDITDIGDDEGICTRAARIRPIATFRQQQDGRA